MNTMIRTLFIVVVVTVNTYAISTNDLVGYYSFNGHLKDSSLSQQIKNGSAVGTPGYVTSSLFGDDGNAVTVGDSGTSYVTLGTPDDYQFGDSASFTFTYWIKLPNSIGSDPTLVGNKNWSTSGQYVGFVQAVYGDDIDSNIGDGTNRADPDLIDIDHDLDWDAQGRSADDPNRWTFLAVTVDRNSNTMTNYAMDGWVTSQWNDNSEPKTANISSVGSVDSGYPVNIGQDGDGGGYTTLNAAFDDMTIWRRALSESEIWEIYSAGRNGNSFGDIAGIPESPSLLNVDMTDIVFPSQFPESTAPATLPLTLENIGVGDVNFQASIINDTLGEYSVSPATQQTLSQGQSMDVNITWNPSAAPGGIHSAQLNITHDSDQDSPFIINLIGRIHLFDGKKVLIIGIDGCRSDQLQLANTPNMDGLIANGSVTYDAYAGGVLGEPTEQPTLSGSGWSSILTAVWANKHGVASNDFTGSNFDEYPCFFEYIRTLYPDAYLASVVHWPQINTEIVTGADTEIIGIDSVVATSTANLLTNEEPDVIFVQLDDVDHAGHTYDYDSPEYRDAIEVSDTHIGTMVSAMQSRPNYTEEDWLVVVTTDHGGINYNHGGQTDEERNIFIIASGNSVCQQTISPGPGQVAIPHTAMRHLGIPVDPAWGWEDDAFGLVPPLGDVTGPAGRTDCTVDFWDLGGFAEQYLEEGLINASADFTGPTGSSDGAVNLYDFALFANYWLESSL